jgi:hypothetical protein
MLILAMWLAVQALPEATPERCRAAAAEVSSSIQFGRSLSATLAAAGRTSTVTNKQFRADQKRIDLVVRRYRASDPSPAMVREVRGYTSEMDHRLLDACAAQAR